MELPSGWQEFEFHGRSIPIPVALVERIAVIQHADRVGYISLLSNQKITLWRVMNSNQISEFMDTGIRIETLLSMAVEGQFAEVNGLDECVIQAIGNLTLDLYSWGRSSGAYRFNEDLVLNEEKSERERWSYFWRNEKDELVHASWSLLPEQLGILRRVEQPGVRGVSVLQDLLSCAEHRTFGECTEIESTEFQITYWNESLERVNSEQ